MCWRQSYIFNPYKKMQTFKNFLSEPYATTITNIFKGNSDKLLSKV